MTKAPPGLLRLRALPPTQGILDPTHAASPLELPGLRLTLKGAPL